nr:hypothetical protein [Tanacetum cinerariifolium]
MNLLQEALNAYAALTRRVKHLKRDKAVQNLEITKLKTRVKKLERANKDESNQGKMIDELDRDEGVALIGEKEEEKKLERLRILLVMNILRGGKLRYIKFTLDQMLNAVRLQVEEQSEMSLELLRFIRQ